ncbi:hypothetical protein [Giesbergeria anulus]|uniref:Uncharacterized protein n=1 Tax=Giesbergeria anulus TaxID=180197 RepID=A0A1H9NCC8_9BURK|nr:hypothetical protein [Giesbergeria anulus]SER33345.1 hypothetical protein SAMN02982919_02161 [Giesbergeria anulus]
MEDLIEQLKQTVPPIEGKCCGTQLELSRAIGFLGRAIKEAAIEECRSHEALRRELSAMCESLELWRQFIAIERIH